MSAVLISAWQVKVKFGDMSPKAKSVIKRCGIRVAYKYVPMDQLYHASGHMGIATL